MEPTTAPKLPDMVMCGDHPSFNKTELNAKEEEKDQPIPISFSKLSSTSARSERGERRRARTSVHALRVTRHASRGGTVADIQGHSSALVQGLWAIREAKDSTPAAASAALGSFRWPPYLLMVWVLVLILTHALHCLVGCLERALPRLRDLCEYLRSCAEQQWRVDAKYRVYPAALAALTGFLYLLYFALYVTYSVSLWSIEPLSVDDKITEPSVETKVTDYEDTSKSDTSLK